MSVGKRERLKGRDGDRSGGRRGIWRKRSCVCIRASLIGTAANGHQRVRVIRNKKQDRESREVTQELTNKQNNRQGDIG